MTGRLLAAVICLIGLFSASGADAATHPAPVQISLGKVGTLRPGRTRPVMVSLRNPNRWPVRVTLSATVYRTSSRSCRPRPGNVQARAFPAVIRVPARATRTGRWLQVAMPATVDPACQRSKFAITLGTKTHWDGRR